MECASIIKLEKYKPKKQKMGKKCTGCKNVVSLENFAKDSKTKDGFRFFCKKCYKFTAYKIDSKFKKRSFKITREEFNLILEIECYYCGGPGFGIDRIDSNVGYEKGNCVSCCTWCNKMKLDNNSVEFIKKCKTIVDYQLSKVYN